MSEIHSLIKYNPDNAQIDTSGMCRKVCGLKWDMLEKIEGVLTAKDYNEMLYKDPCVIVQECEKNMRDSCIMEFVKDYNLK